MREAVLRRAASAAWCAGALLASATASAQAGPAGSPQPATAANAPADEARRQFEIGVEAVRDERYADALTAFRASYAIRRAPSVALNLGITLRALGHLVEARRYLEEFRRDATPTQHTEHDATVAEFLADLDRRIATLQFVETSPADLDLTVDGQPVTLDAHGAVALDPGEHQVTGSARGFTAARQIVQVASGEHATLRLVLRPAAPERPPVLVASPANPHPRAEGHAAGTPVWGQWWFWTGVTVVVAAAVVIPVAVAASSGYADPAQTSTGRVLQGLSLPQGSR